MNVIIIQSEGAVKFYPSPKGSSSRQEIINLLLMAARTLAPSLLAWNVMEQLVLLHALVCADVTYYAAVRIVMSYLLYRAVFFDNHTIVAHIILYVVMPAIDCAIGILQLR